MTFEIGLVFSIIGIAIFLFFTEKFTIDTGGFPAHRNLRCGRRPGWICQPCHNYRSCYVRGIGCNF